jgi:KEOPS complex subunit Pcc1
VLLTSISIFQTPAASRIYRSLKPELESQVTERSSVYMKVEKSAIFLEIRSDDLVAMRSTLNTWLRLIQVASETADCLV